MTPRVLAVAAGILAGGATAALLWPTSNCISTLIGFEPGQPDPNSRTCHSVIGLPANAVVASIIAAAAAAIVYALVRRRLDPGDDGNP